jgi:hypothetical protein
MNIVVLIGARAGTVQDLPVLTARAMVADGRARWPEGSPHAPPSPDAQADGMGETADDTQEQRQSAPPSVQASSGRGHSKHSRR